MVGRLQDKVCIITGTGSGMGRAAARIFAREGARVVGCDVNVDTAEATVEQVRTEGGEMVSMQPCDLTDPAQCEELVRLAVETYGQIDVLYNNAAMAYFAWIEDMTDELWGKNMEEEVSLVFRLCRAAWPYLKQRGGSIVNVASMSGWVMMKDVPQIAHSTAKGAILSMTRHLAMEGGPHGIRANSVSPGSIETAQTRKFLEDPAILESAQDRAMLHRVGRADEVANAALFLASDEASYITAADLLVDGGVTAW